MLILLKYFSILASIVAGSSASLVSNSSHLATSTSLNLIDSFGTNPPHKNPEQQMERELAKLPKPSIQPIDSAAHLHIMGEHLVKLGRFFNILSLF